MKHRRSRGSTQTALSWNGDRFLFYQHYFRFLEINHTFYREPDAHFFLELERKSRPDMIFAVKVNRLISHATRRVDAEACMRMQAHVSAVAPLVETGRFFSFLLQLDDRLERSQRLLDHFTRVCAVAVEARLDIHLELRHVTWHNEHALQTLKDHGIGICNTDIPRLPHAFPLKAYATTPKGYVRYSGLNAADWTPAHPPGRRSHRESREARNRRYHYLYSAKELEERVEGQIKLLRKCDSVAVAFNNHYQAGAVANALANLELVRGRFGIQDKERAAVVPAHSREMGVEPPMPHEASHS